VSGVSLPTNQRTLLTYTVLVGLSPLVPVPFVDDMITAYFMRRMMRSLAREHDWEPDAAAVRTLVDEPAQGLARGCAAGCLSVVVYPLKKILRNLFVFLEFKRAVDLASEAYHRGFLLDYAMREGWLGAAAAHTPEAVRTAIDETLAEAPIKPIEEAVRFSFRQSKRTLVGVATILADAIKQRFKGAKIDDVSTAVEAVEERETGLIDGVVDALRARVDAIPEEHFESLRSGLAGRLGVR
jgi:hypothetical protein